MQLVLASASPARRALLTAAGFAPTLCPSQVDEAAIVLEDPAALVGALAIAKAEAVAHRLCNEAELRRSLVAESARVALVLGCDSLLWLHGQAWGKPASPEAAIARWQAMRGQVGTLYTGHALVEVQRQGEAGEESWAIARALDQTAATQVRFGQPSDAQIAAYVATGEPLACAGCFAIDGRGGLFVEGIDGCHTNVIGLSLPCLRQMLDRLGYDVTQFW